VEKCQKCTHHSHFIIYYTNSFHSRHRKPCWTRAHEYNMVIVVFVSLFCCHFIGCILDHNVTHDGPLVVYGVRVGNKMMITLVHNALLELEAILFWNSKRDGTWKWQSMSARYSCLFDCIFIQRTVIYFLLMNFCCPRYLLLIVLIEWDVMPFWIKRWLLILFIQVKRTIEIIREWRWGTVMWVAILYICSISCSLFSYWSFLRLVYYRCMNL
jgi:hypothetical protein